MKAAIYIRTGATPEQQQAACLAYCDRHDYTATSLCCERGDAAALVEVGAVAVVVAAYAGDDRHLVARVVAAGGRLEYARPPRGGRRVVDVEQLAVGMLERGATVDQIAHLLDVPVAEVRAALRRR